ncbi:ABC transporter permease [Sphaerisporangium aureirubrum]|uniref:ABC transporter permease n=1 Tax=Sphaerisporangium aureirubrum TaxID=1544736 RepID=A0ABW1NGH4_9ACTN
MSTFAGTAKLIRLVLRRDRLLLPVWVLITGLIPASYVVSINQLFPTAAGRQGYADASTGNVGFIALYGPLSGSGVGELVAWRAGFIPVMIGLFSVLTVIRHTRTDEETGRRELLGATVVGRHAGLAAAVLTTLAANAVIGLVLAVNMLGQGLAPTGSWLFGLEFAVSGWVFTGIGAIAAQLTENAGGARAIAVSVLGVAYALRMAGDVSALSGGPLSWLPWLSPIGWAQKIAPYSADAWGPAVLTVVAAALLVVVAVALSARRDVGSGLLPSRLGPVYAAPGLRSPLALSWRLHRGLLAGWVVTFALLGVLFGGLADSVGDLVRDSREMADVFARIGGAGALVDSYFAAMMGLFGLIGAAYGIQACLRLRAEEGAGRAEPLLGTAVGRLRWAASHLVFATLGPAVALVAAGLAVGATYGAIIGDVGGEMPRVLVAALVQLPAVWVLTAVPVVLFGLLPRVAAVSWGALVVCLLISLVGGALGVSQWVLDISPFTHLPHLPGGDVTAAPLVVLVALAAVLGLAGLAALRRRDMPAT